MADLIIRPYQPDDRAGLFRIAADTAFFGAPVETYLEDRRLMCDLVYSYYTDYEPEHAWIAASDQVADGVAGFLTGCVDTQRHEVVMGRHILPAIIGRILQGRYRVGSRTWQYVMAGAGAGLHRQFPHVDLAVYPAHLHINLDEAARGHGAGRRLMTAYLEQLAGLGVRGVHLRTTNLNMAAIALYLKLGFSLLDARRTTLWRHFAAEPVENRAYGLALG